jgi:hypothetical protein
MPKTKRYVIHADVEEKKAPPIAFQLSEEFIRGAGEPQEVLLFIPQLGSFPDALEEALGKAASRRLKENGFVRFKDQGKLRLETRRTFKKWKGPANIVIGIYVTKEMLDQIDSTRNSKAVIIVPWHMDDLTGWVSKWNPEIISGPKDEQS